VLILCSNGIPVKIPFYSESKPRLLSAVNQFPKYPVKGNDGMGILPLNPNNLFISAEMPDMGHCKFVSMRDGSVPEFGNLAIVEGEVMRTSRASRERRTHCGKLKKCNRILDGW